MSICFGPPFLSGGGSVIKSGYFYLKAEGQRILEHPGLTLWSTNLRRKRFCKHRQCSFTAPKKCTFCSTSGHKTFSYQDKFETLFQMTYGAHFLQGLIIKKSLVRKKNIYGEKYTFCNFFCIPEHFFCCK